VDNADNLTNQLVTNSYAGRALVPASPWLRPAPLPLPQPDPAVRHVDGHVEIRWTPQPAGGQVTWWAVQVRRKGIWHLDQVLPSVGFGIRLPAASGIDRVAVSAVSRFGDKGPATVVSVPPN
jgi:hypothetical protein